MYSGRLKSGTQVLCSPDGILVGSATLPIWQSYFNGLLNRPPPALPPLQHQQLPEYPVPYDIPSQAEVLAVLKKMKNHRAPGDDAITADMLKHLPESGIRELTRTIQTIWKDRRIPDTWREAVIIPLHKKSSVTQPSNYRGISLLRVTYKILERLILERLIQHREARCRDEQAGFRPGRSTIDQVFALRRLLEIRHRYHEPTQVAFLDFEAAFDSPDRDRLFAALRADGVPQDYVTLLKDMNAASTAIVQTPCGRTGRFNVETGVRQGSVAGPFLFNIVIDDIMRRTAEQFPAEVLLHPSGRGIMDMDYADDIAIFAESNRSLQQIVDFVSETAAAYGLKLRADKCKQMFDTIKPSQGISVNGSAIELVSQFMYLGCLLMNSGSYAADLAQRCAKATGAFNALSKCLWSSPISKTVKLRVYLTAIRPILMYGSETWAAPPTTISKIDVTERKLFRRMLGYFYPDVVHTVDLYREVNDLYQSLTRNRHTRLRKPSEQCTMNRLRLLGHILRRPDGRLTKDALFSVPAPNWKRPAGGSRKLWTEVVKEDLISLNIEKQFGRDRTLRKLWNGPNFLLAVQPIAEDRTLWAKLTTTSA